MEEHRISLLKVSDRQHLRRDKKNRLQDKEEKEIHQTKEISDGLLIALISFLSPPVFLRGVFTCLIFVSLLPSDRVDVNVSTPSISFVIKRVIGV
jgi:hypothetical protein